MTGEKCRHCGGRIEYVEFWHGAPDEALNGFWKHVSRDPIFSNHEAAPAFGGGS